MQVSASLLRITHVCEKKIFHSDSIAAEPLYNRGPFWKTKKGDLWGLRHSSMSSTLPDKKEKP